jgi:hypothetical protein
MSDPPSIRVVATVTLLQTEMAAITSRTVAGGHGGPRPTRYRAEIKQCVRTIGRIRGQAAGSKQPKVRDAQEFGAAIENFNAAVTAGIISRDPAKLAGTLAMMNERSL